MGDALLTGCSTVGCPHLVEKAGPCDACRASGVGRGERRGSAADRGYGGAWQVLRLRFRRLLLGAGVPPVCGARLPGARPAPQSRCLAAGQLVDDTLHRLRFHGKGLHTDHIVPHRGDPVLFRDPLNLQLLCRDEHTAKTAREAGRGPRP